MDNTENLGAQLAAAAAQSQEQRIQALEYQVKFLTNLIGEMRGFNAQVAAQSNAQCQWAGILGGHQNPKDQRAAQQPHGWYGYTGDAGGPLKY